MKEQETNPVIRKPPIVFAALCALALGACGETAAVTATDASAPRDVRADVVSDVPLPPPSPLTAASPTAPFDPPEATMRRLTQTQYRNTIHDLFGDDVLVTGAMEPDLEIDGFFSIGAGATSISARGVEQYESLAYDIAEQLLREGAHRTSVVGCSPSGVTDDACTQTVLRAMGRRLYRRPITDTEATALTAVAHNAQTVLADFHRGLQYGVAAMLQSPDFLFRPELGAPDPGRANQRRFTGYEMASRLSYFLWNGPPDDALLDAAERGDLVTDEGIDRESRRMMGSPKARRALRAFVSEWLHLGELDDLVKDTMVFTSFSPEIGPAAREETLRDFERLVFDLDGDYRQIFTTRETFVNRRLAALYDVRAPVNEGFGLVTLPETLPRRGLLGHLGILAMYAHPTSSSPTLRGKFIRQSLLCDVIPPPPVNVNTALPEPTGMRRTMRERLQTHLTNDTCTGCHSLMDPIGLGLENFNGLGLYRRTDNGAAITTFGNIDTDRFTDVTDLSRLLHDHPSVGPCMVDRMYRYATGHAETDSEQVELAHMTDFYAAQGYRIRQLMFAIATSDGFRRAGVRGTP